MPHTTPTTVLTSVPLGRLAVTAGLDTDLELKLDWEDDAVLTGERPLGDVLDEAAVDPSRVASVHLPPGVRTRGRDIGMAATEANVGAVLDFVHGQLADLPGAFLVMHPPREFDYGDQLSLLRELCDLTGRDVCLENPPDASYWQRPEDLAFFGYVGARHEAWSALYLTVDSAHLPPARTPPDRPDGDALDRLFDRLDPLPALDGAAVRDGVVEYLSANVASHAPADPDGLSADGWLALLNTLVLSADRVRSVHFNDPVRDGVPDLCGPGERPTLDAVREVVRSAGIHLVLEPEREAFDRPRELRGRIEAVEAWLEAAGDD